MRRFVFFCIFFQFTLCLAQKKIFLTELNNEFLTDLNIQGLCNFKKSPFYEEKEMSELYVYPSFMVTVNGEFDEIDFKLEEDILNKLFFEKKSIKKSTKKLLIDVSWNLINLRDSIVYSSDFKQYYKYRLNEKKHFFYGNQFIFPIKKIGLKNIKFSFSLYNFDAFIVFYVTKNNTILILDQRIEKWMTLEEFNKELKEKKYTYDKL